MLALRARPSGAAPPSVYRYIELRTLVGFVEVDVNGFPPGSHQLVSQVCGTVDKYRDCWMVFCHECLVSRRVVDRQGEPASSVTHRTPERLFGGPSQTPKDEALGGQFRQGESSCLALVMTSKN